MNLYELTSKLSQLLDEFSLCEDEDRLNELESEIGTQSDNIEKKIEACCVVYKNLQSQATAREIEIARLKKQKERIDSGLERLRKWISLCAAPGTKWEVGSHRLKWRPSERCILKVPVKDLPPIYVRENISYEANLSDLKKDLKLLRADNRTLPFAELQKHYSLVIE